MNTEKFAFACPNVGFASPLVKVCVLLRNDS